MTPFNSFPCSIFSNMLDELKSEVCRFKSCTLLLVCCGYFTCHIVTQRTMTNIIWILLLLSGWILLLFNHIIIGGKNHATTSLFLTWSVICPRNHSQHLKILASLYICFFFQTKEGLQNHLIWVMTTLQQIRSEGG